MSDCQSKTWLGETLERGVTSAVSELKDVIERLNFIRRGVVALDDIGDAKAGMECLLLVEERLDDLILDIEDNLKRVRELDAVAAGASSFLIRGHGEHELYEVLQEGRQMGDFCVEFMARAARKAMEVYGAGHQMPKEPIPDDSKVAAVVAGLAESAQPVPAVTDQEARQTT